MGGSKSSTQTQTVTTPAQTVVTPVSRSVSVVVGYRYYMGVHMGLTHGPVDFVSRIQVGGKVAWQGISEGGRIHINASGLFGGDSGEGGVSGDLDFLQGEPNQAVNDYLAARLNGMDGTPAFRGVTSAVLRQMYVSANNPYLKPWQYTMTRTDVVRRGEEQWEVDTARIIQGDESGEEPEGDDSSYTVTGANVDTYQNNGKTYHRSTQAGTTKTLTVTERVRLQILLVGGGGGRASEGGGAGAGGVKTLTYTFDPGTYSIVLGVRGVRSGTGPDDGGPTYVKTQAAASDPANAIGGVVALGGARGKSNCDGPGVGGSQYASGGGGPYSRGTFDSSSASGCFGSPQPGGSGVDSAGGAGGESATCTRSNGTIKYAAGGGGGGGGAGGSGESGQAGSLGAGACNDKEEITGAGGAGGHGVSINFDGTPRYIAWGGHGYGIGDNVPVSKSTTTNAVAWGSGSEMTSFGVGPDGGTSAFIVRLIEVVPAEAGPCADLNPAQIIRECLTNNEWGMGYLESDIDDDSFTASADTLYEEKLGVSLLWDRETTIESFVDEVIRHVDAVLYVDRTTGLFRLKLIRYDYNPDALITLSPLNIERLENYRKPSFGELVNTITVLYMECPDDIQSSVTLQDIALVQMQGGSIGATVEYMGFSNRKNANYAAQRDLRALAVPLISCTIYTGPDAASLDIGDTFKLEWPDFQDDAMVMRITGMAFGDGKTQRIRIDCVQDVFATPEEPMLSDDASLWRNPNQPPGPVQNQMVTEAPYWLALRKIYGLDDKLQADPDIGGFITAAAPPFSGVAEDSTGSVYYGSAMNATVNTNDGVEWVQVATMDFCPFAVLAEAIGYTDTELVITDADQLGAIEVGTFAQIGEELVRVDAIVTDSNDVTTITVGRGILDTVPTPHAAGVGIFAWQDFFGTDYDEYLAGESLTFALRPRNGSGILPLADAPTMALTFNSRLLRPYPPGNVQVNGVPYPDAPFLPSDTLTVTWSHRDRLQQTGEEIEDTTFGNIGPEAGVTYSLEIYEGPTLLVAEYGLTGTTWTEDVLLGEGEYNVLLWSELPGESSEDLTSWQVHEFPVVKQGPIVSSEAPYSPGDINDPIVFDCTSDQPELNDPIIFECEVTSE